MSLHASLATRGAPTTYSPPGDARFVGVCEGLRLYLHLSQRGTWTYYVLGPGNVLLDFNGFGTEHAAERHGAGSLSRLADAVAV